MTDLIGSIIGVNGDIIEHGVDGFKLAQRPGIFGAGPVQLNPIEAAGLVGGTFDGTPKYRARPLRWSLLIDQTSPNGLYEAIERLSAAVMPVTPHVDSGRNCRLLVTRPDGTSRQIAARYSTGLDAVEIRDAKTDIIRVDLLFRCSDPHWSSVSAEEVTVSFPITNSGAVATAFNEVIDFDALGVPFDGYQSTALAGTSIATLTNSGTAHAWPVWTVAGAATSVELTSRATGGRWRWEGTLNPGSELEIVTDERAPSVRVDGVNSIGGMAAGSRLFPLIAGDNEIVATVLGSDTETTVAALWRDRHLNP